MDASAIVLAGGRSSRMGANKAQLDFGGVPIVRRIVQELGQRFGEIILVAGPDGPGIKLAGVKLIHDEEQFAGPLDALRRGLLASSNGIAFACSCDLPLMKAELAAKLCELIGDHDAAIPLVEGRNQVLCAAYKKAAARTIGELVAGGEKRMQSLLDTLNFLPIDDRVLRKVDPALRSFINVNTPEDYARAISLLRGSQV